MMRPRKKRDRPANCDDVIRANYPERGYPGCRDQLPTMGRDDIHRRAAELGVFYLNRPRQGKRCTRPRRDDLPPVTMRKCLRCAEDFASDGPHNRICRPCKNSEDWRSGGVSNAVWA